MGLMPQVSVIGPGASVINGRLVSWERVDAAGLQSDQIKLVVDVSGQSGLPQEGAVLQWLEGYQGQLVDKGKFKITRIIPRLFPPTITVVATAAPFQVQDVTRFKERRSRSFGRVVLAELFRQVVAAHGFSPRVDPAFEGVVLDHVDQVDETDSAFLTRVAKQYDAVVKPVNQLYVLARRGQVKTISGRAIQPVEVGMPDKNTHSDLSCFINCQLDRPSRASFFGVRAGWSDLDTGSESMVEVGREPFKKIRQSYASEAVAVQACRDELRRIRRQGSSLRLDLPGDPAIVAEGLLRLSKGFPSYMAGDWSIDKVVARGDSKGGYRCSVRAAVLV